MIIIISDERKFYKQMQHNLYYKYIWGRMFFLFACSSLRSINGKDNIVNNMNVMNYWTNNEENIIITRMHKKHVIPNNMYKQENYDNGNYNRAYRQ